MTKCTCACGVELDSDELFKKYEFIVVMEILATHIRHLTPKPKNPHVFFNEMGGGESCLAHNPQCLKCTVCGEFISHTEQSGECPGKVEINQMED